MANTTTASVPSTPQPTYVLRRAGETAASTSTELELVVIVAGVLVALLFVFVVIFVVRTCVMARRRSGEEIEQDETRLEGGMEMEYYNEGGDYASVEQRNGNLYVQTIQRHDDNKRSTMTSEHVANGNVYTTTIESDDAANNNSIARDNDGHAIYAQVSRKSRDKASTGSRYENTDSATSNHRQSRKASDSSLYAPKLPSRNFKTS